MKSSERNEIKIGNVIKGSGYRVLSKRDDPIRYGDIIGKIKEVYDDGSVLINGIKDCKGHRYRVKFEDIRVFNYDMWEDRRRVKKRNGEWIYFIQGVDGGPIKIGRSMYPESRLKELQAGSPVNLRIVAKYKQNSYWSGIDESSLHKEFREDNLHGEWFNPSLALLKRIEKIGIQRC